QNKPIDLERTPDHVIKATLATEDRRFFSHFGVDFIGIARAFATNVKAGGVVEGGSTITQQVAKNIFLSNERTIARKAKEAFIALWLDANLTKQEILQLYFNRAYLGGGAFGIPAAAEFYFDKDYADLTLAESAMLAGLFKAPTNFAPHINLASARERANEVLTNMVQAGFLTEGQVLAARQNPAAAVNRKRRTTPDYFLDWAYQQVLKMKISEDRVLTVVTGLDSSIQEHSENTINRYLTENGDLYNISQGATVIMSPEGYVRAMVGGRDYGQSQFNRAVDALRSPGSTFKAFVYSAAMESGMNAQTKIVDGPVCIRNWCPKNYTRRYSGSQTLTTALVKSINTIPVKIGLQLGVKKIVQTTQSMGVTSELRANPSLPIGTSEVSVLDMTTGYSVFANGGYKAVPKAVVRIYDSTGNLIRDVGSNIERERVLQASSVASMNEILSQVPEWGTGRRAKLDDRKTAGKTGTTQAYRDAWFIGYTGNYVAAVWYGNDNYTPTNELTGGRLPAMTWKDLMTFAHQGVEKRPIPFINQQGKADLKIADATASGDEATSTPISEIRALSVKSTNVLNSIGALLDQKKQGLAQGFIPLKKAEVDGLKTIAGEL
ncbi:MAG: PBP1A family penicillin-binding protein, partial [Pseudomonadota bacterium]